MSSPTHSIRLRGLGKVYNLFESRQGKVLDAIGLGRVLPQRMTASQPFWALRGIDLDIRRGERVGIIGHNGAGKSTLLKLICSNLAPTEGSISVQGRIQALLEIGTGFHPEFNGRENIRASLALHGLSPARIRACMDDIIEFAELEEFIDQPLKTYSAGMGARLAFSTATAVEPEILIIDEILGAGDAYFAAKCLERMRKLTIESGATVLFVSHDLGSVQSMCDRCVWIDRGRVRQDGAPLDVSKAYYKQVQERDNRRRLAAAQGLSHKDMPVDADLHLFRFRTADGKAPATPTPIRAIRLLDGGQERLHLDVGGPMDNDREQDAYVYTAARYMNWSDAERDQTGYWRAFADCGGRYGHAPFQLRISDPKWERLTLQIEAEVSSDVFVDVFVDEDYVPLGALKRDADQTDVSLAPVAARATNARAGDVSTGARQGATTAAPSDTRTPQPANAPRAPAAAPLEIAASEPSPARIVADTATTTPRVVVTADRAVDQPTPVLAADGPRHAAPVRSGPASIVTWKEPDPKITGVRFLNGEGEAVGGITVGDDLVVEIAYRSSRLVRGPVFAMTFYLPDGRHLIHANNKLAGIDIDEIEGDGVVRFVFRPFPGGPCDLVMSTSIFEYLDPRTFATMPPFYDQHDRAHELKVWQSLDSKLNPGLVNARYMVEQMVRQR